MPVICQLCHRSFEKQITNSHLRSHQTSTSEYKATYGDDSLSSPEYRAEKANALSGDKNPMFGKEQTDETKQLISAKRAGKPAHNRGKTMSDEQKDILREKAIARNIVWSEQGNHPLLGRTHTEGTKQKIKEKRKDQTITPEMVEKAWATKRANGWISPMLGKSHSDETKQKIIDGGREYREQRKQETLRQKQSIIASLNLTFVDYDGHYMTLKCNVCGHTFMRTPQVFDSCRVREDICDKCHPRIHYTSKAEIEIADYISSLIPDEEVRTRDRYVIGRGELDIFIPSHKIAVEYNGLYWHSEAEGKFKDYHLSKLEKCLAKDIRLITIFEDEYVNHADIVKSRLSNLLGRTPTTIGARKCQLIEISSSDANSFLRQNHMQGSGRSNVRYGLVYNSELVSVMTFSKENISRKITTWELNRFASKTFTNIIGGASRLLKYFAATHNPDSIISYADRRWSNGNVYSQLGFTFEGFTPPNYWYIDGLSRIHRYALRKTSTDDPNLTEVENRKIQGWNRIWDCGSIRYLWRP